MSLFRRLGLCLAGIGLFAARASGQAFNLRDLLTEFLREGITLAPPAAWWLLASPFAAVPGWPVGAVLIAGMNTALYALAGRALYLAAVRRFARENEPPVVSPRAGP